MSNKITHIDIESIQQQSGAELSHVSVELIHRQSGAELSQTSIEIFSRKLIDPSLRQASVFYQTEMSLRAVLEAAGSKDGLAGLVE